jgi:hypothetical protein
VLVFWAMVSLHMNLLNFVLYNDTADTSDCLMWQGWMISDEVNGGKLLFAMV